MNATDWDREHLWRFRARPLRVIDGDTFTALSDTGYGGRHEAHIRIAGLNAPEKDEPGGPEATAALMALLGPGTWAAALHAWNLRIVSTQRETIVSETRSFERFVATCYIVGPDGEMSDLRELLCRPT